MNQSIMTVPLKLLELPWVAQTEVINKMSILDIIKFSLSSPDLFSIAKSANRRVGEIHWCFGDDEAVSEIQLIEKKEEVEFSLEFPSPEELEESREKCCKGQQYSDVFTKLTIQGVTVFLSSTQQNANCPYYQTVVVDYVEPSKEHQTKVMKMFTEHIWTLSKYRGHGLYYSSTNRIIVCWVFDFTTQFSCLVIDNESSEDKMTAQEIQWLLETVKCDDVFFRPPVPKDRAYLGPLTTKYIHMEHAEWLSLESLLNSEVVDILIFKDSLRDAELNMIIRKWMDGGLPKLQSFVMEFQDPLVHSRNIVFNGVNHAPADETTRPPYFYDYIREDWARNEDAVDIKSNDGKLTATVTMGKMYGDGIFGMFVWHEKYNLKTDD